MKSNSQEQYKPAISMKYENSEYQYVCIQKMSTIFFKHTKNTVSARDMCLNKSKTMLVKSLFIKLTKTMFAR